MIGRVFVMAERQRSNSYMLETLTVSRSPSITSPSVGEAWIKKDALCVEVIVSVYAEGQFTYRLFLQLEKI